MCARLFTLALDSNLPLPPAGSAAIDWTAPSTFIPIAAMLIGLALIASQTLRKRAADRADTPAPRFGASAELAEVRALVADVRELSDRLASETEARAQRLERLVSAADAKLSQLQAASSAPIARPAAVAPPAPAQPAAARPSDSQLYLEPKHVEPKRQGPAPVPRGTAPVAPAPAVSIESPAPSAPLDARHGAIYHLADAGLSPVQIARQTGLPTGQVELIIGLRRAAARAN
jgi:hypothetical protein